MTFLTHITTTTLLLTAFNMKELYLLKNKKTLLLLSN
jgi:hypothetical protein